MGDGTLPAVYRQLTNGEEVKLRFSRKEDYETLRTSLLRKFKRDNKAFEDLGFDGPGAAKFIKCSWDGKESIGTFRIEQDSRRQHNGQPKVYGESDL